MKKWIVFLCIFSILTESTAYAQNHTSSRTSNQATIIRTPGNGEFDAKSYKLRRLKHYRAEVRNGVVLMITGGALVGAGGIIYGATTTNRGAGTLIGTEVLIAGGSLVFLSGLFDLLNGKAHIRHYNLSKVSLIGTKSSFGLAYNIN